MNKFVRGIVGVIAAAVMVGSGVSVAEARVTQVPSAPVRVVVNVPVPSFQALLKTNTTLDGKHYASLWFVSPVTGRLTFAGEGGGESATVRVLADLDAASIAPHWGLVDGVAVDDVDGRSTPVTLDVRRRSRVFLSRPTVSRGKVSFVAGVQHYDGGVSETYIESKKSPVRLQERIDGKWVHLSTARTDSEGMATLVATASPGRHRYRVYRPNGATVWSAVSLSRAVDVG